MFSWGIVGQQIVGQLADSLTTALNQAIPTLASALNPVRKASTYADMVKNMIGKVPSNTQGTNGTAAPSATQPKDAADPAYSQVGRDLVYWHLIKVVLFGTDNGIDWSKARGESTIAFTAKMLGNSQRQFASLATSAEPSQQYKAALESVCKVSHVITFYQHSSLGVIRLQLALLPGWTRPRTSRIMRQQRIRLSSKLGRRSSWMDIQRRSS